MTSYEQSQLEIQDAQMRLQRRSSKPKAKAIDGFSLAKLPHDTRPAYALLRGTHIAFHVRTLSVTLGKRLKRGVDIQIGDCASITRRHVTISYNFSIRRWELLILGKAGLLLNSVAFSLGCAPVLVQSRDLIEIPCDACDEIHAFYFLLPRNCPDSGIPKNMIAYESLETEHRPWTNTERERFQRGFLSLGYHRPLEIKRAAALSKRTIWEIEEYSKAFLLTMNNYCGGEEKRFLDTLIELENIDQLEDGSPRPEEESIILWKKLARSAVPWARRIRNLHYLQEAVRLNVVENRDLLYGIDLRLFESNKPASWWSINDDRTLLMGTFRYGYARYDDICADSSLKFTRDSSHPSWPSCEQITRRLKRLVDAGRKALIKKDFLCVNNVESLPVSTKLNRKLLLPSVSSQARVPTSLPQHFAIHSNTICTTEAQIWSRTQRDSFLFALQVIGRHSKHGRPDWQFLKHKCNLAEKWDITMTMMYESFLEESNEVLAGNNLFTVQHEFDIMTPAVANKFKLRLRMLDLIRNYIIPFPSFFALVDQHAPAVDRTQLSWWIRGSNDAQLLIGVERHGFGEWASVFRDESFLWPVDIDQIGVPPPNAINERVQVLVDALAPVVSLKPLSSSSSSSSSSSTVLTDAFIESLTELEAGETLEDGLELYNLGFLNSESCFSENNIYPIGYCSVREHSDEESGLGRLRYRCQIRLKDSMPVFLVTLLSENAHTEPLDYVSSIDAAWEQGIKALYSLLSSPLKYNSEVMCKREIGYGAERFGLQNTHVQARIQALMTAEAHKKSAITTSDDDDEDGDDDDEDEDVVENESIDYESSVKRALVTNEQTEEGRVMKRSRLEH